MTRETAQPSSPDGTVLTPTSTSDAATGSISAPVVTFSAAEIAATLPHAHPFLFLESACLVGRKATGSYRLDADHPLLAGHFPGNPVFPAALMLEALGQLAVLLLLRGADLGLGSTSAIDPQSIFFISADGVRCKRRCVPGETLQFSVELKRAHHPLATFLGSVTVGTERAAFAEAISLTFDFLP